MTVKVIGYPSSPNVLRVIFTLNELNVPYEVAIPSEFSEIKTPEYLANNHPFGRMPAIVDGDIIVNESQAIARYLVSKYQGKYNSNVLIPPNDIHKAARIDQFLSYDQCYYNPPVAQIVYQEYFAQYREGPNPEKLKEACKNTESSFEVYDKLLDGKDYLIGEFSLADIIHYPPSYLAIKSGHEDLWDSKPNLKKWKDNMCAREAWKKTVVHFEQAQAQAKK